MVDIEKIIDDYNVQKKAFLDTMQRELSGYFVEVAKKFKVEAIRWAQYTPYYNDGDLCVFGVHDIEVQFSGEDDFDDAYTDNQQRQATIAAIREIRKKIPNEVLEAVLGDHIQVTVTQETVTVDEYDHD